MNASNKTRTTLSMLGGSVLVAATLLVAVGCNKDEPPPPLPAAKPSAAPVAAPLKIQDEDAGKPKEEPKGKGGPGKPAPSLAACCAALRQNAESAPPPTGDYMKQAAAMCDAMAASGANKQTLVAAIQGALRGASMPAGCR
jgi:hypothetical protein